MSDLSTVDLSKFGQAALFLPDAAICVAKAESEIGVLLWECGQALHYVRENCPPEELEAAWETIGLKPTRARQYIDVYERWPKIADVPAVGKSLLFVLAAPEAPAEAVEAIVDRVESGENVTVREAVAEIKESKAQTSAPINHDVDRTRLAPEQDDLDGMDAVKRAIKSIRKAVDKAAGICKQLKSDRAWKLLEDEMTTMTESVKNE